MDSPPGAVPWAGGHVAQRWPKGMKVERQRLAGPGPSGRRRSVKLFPRGVSDAQENLAAQEASPHEGARLQGAHVHKGWPPRTEGQACQGPRTADRAKERAWRPLSITDLALPKRYRLTRSGDFRRALRHGRCWSDRLVVLCKHRNGLPGCRFGFSVSRRVGNAVIRNRVKRRMAEAVRLRCDLVSTGWDVVFVARAGIVGADYWAIERSVTHLLGLAHLFLGPNNGAEGGTG